MQVSCLCFVIICVSFTSLKSLLGVMVLCLWMKQGFGDFVFYFEA